MFDCDGSQIAARQRLALIQAGTAGCHDTTESDI